MRFAFVIPVYNHARQIRPVLEGCMALGFPVAVVDDGSTDGVTEVLKEFPRIELIRHERNLGKGAALLSGMKAVSGMADFAITIDADGQHVPSDALDMITSIKEGEMPIVVGARKSMLDDKTVPWTSRFGRKFSNFWVRLSGGPELSDSQSGFRIYPVKKVLALRTRARRFQFEVEVLVLAHWMGIPVHEFPVRVVYQGKGIRVSHFRPFADFMRNTVTFTRLITFRILVPKSLRRRIFQI